MEPYIATIILLFIAFAALLLTKLYLKITNFLTSPTESIDYGGAITDFAGWVQSDEQNVESIRKIIAAMFVGPLLDGLMHRFNAMKGGVMKGVNSQMSKAQSDVIGGAIQGMTGIPGMGDMGAGILKKYPWLGLLLALNRGQGSGLNVGGGFFGGTSPATPNSRRVPPPNT